LLTSCASQLPVVDVLVTVFGLLFPQPQTAIASPSAIASFFMNLPEIGIFMRIERCGQGRQWM
jgi:hypothetical protein